MEQDSLSVAIKTNREAKRALLSRMLALTVEEKQLLLSDQAEALRETTAQWQTLSQEVGQIEAAYRAAVVAAASGHQGFLPPRDELATIERECAGFLTQMQALQTEIYALGEQKMKQYRGDLQDARRATKRMASYAGAYPADTDSVYFDMKK